MVENTTLGSLSGEENVNLGAFNLITGALGNPDTISGVISGVGGLFRK